MIGSICEMVCHDNRYSKVLVRLLHVLPRIPITVTVTGLLVTIVTSILFLLVISLLNQIYSS